jgi:hypothetical protein
MNRIIPVMLLCHLLSPLAMADDSLGLQLVESRRIWDKAPHNAFTDLIRFQDRWYCVFREGKGHVSPDGALRVITRRQDEYLSGQGTKSGCQLTTLTRREKGEKSNHRGDHDRHRW